MKQNPTEKKSRWLLPPERQQNLKPGLYVVSTAIGNLGDMGLRALDILSVADAVLCEDTRVTGKLLAHYGIKKTLKIYNDHSDAKAREAVLKKLEDGAMLALVSDAGAPLISDPGYKLVKACRERGIYISAVPGANAVLPALQLSGLPSDAFTFLGFLPAKSGVRKEVLQQWASVPATLVFYESANRLDKSLADIEAVMGTREIAVVREITKLYEETRRGSAAELLSYYEENGSPRGEIVIVVGPPEKTQWEEQDVIAELKKAIQDMPTKKAAAAVAQKTGWTKSVLYDMAVKLK